MKSGFRSCPRTVWVLSDGILKVVLNKINIDEALLQLGTDFTGASSKSTVNIFSINFTYKRLPSLVEGLSMFILERFALALL